MRRWVWWWAMGVVLVTLWGCPNGGGVSAPDPTFSFTPATTYCDGSSLEAGAGVNIYGVPGAGPMPMVAVTGQTPPACNGNMINPSGAGVVKLNAAPLTSSTGNTLTVPSPGPWYFCGEGVSSNGVRGMMSNCVTATVGHSPNPPTITVAGVTIRLMIDEG